MNPGIVTVLYNPNMDLLSLQINAVDTSIPFCFVDNGSSASLLDTIRKIISSRSRSVLIELGSNAGIARAQNIGAERMKQTCSHILFLDHDSVPMKGMLNTLQEAFAALPPGEKVAAIGARLLDARTKIAMKVYSHRWLDRHNVPACIEGLIPVASINGSGMFVDLHAWEDIGGMDEDLFIDHVDTEWSFRAWNRGYRLYCTEHALLEHRMGEDSCRYWCLGWKTMPYRSPLRHYYIVRNSLLLQRRAYVPLKWKLANVLKLLFTLTYFSLLTRQKKRQFMWICKGLIDGVRGKSGRVAFDP